MRPTHTPPHFTTRTPTSRPHIRFATARDRAEATHIHHEVVPGGAGPSRVTGSFLNILTLTHQSAAVTVEHIGLQLKQLIWLSALFTQKLLYLRDLGVFVVETMSFLRL